MRRSHLVLFIALFFIFTFTFIPLGKANPTPQGSASELRDTFNELSSLSKKMPKITKKLTKLLKKQKLPQNWDAEDIAAFYDELDEAMLKINEITDKVNVALLSFEEDLQASALPQKALDRYSAFIAKYESNLQKLNELYENLNFLRTSLLLNRAGAPVILSDLERDRGVRLEIKNNLDELTEFMKNWSGSTVKGNFQDSTIPPPKLIQNNYAEPGDPKTGGTYKPAYLLNKSKSYLPPMVPNTNKVGMSSSFAAPMPGEIMQSLGGPTLPEDLVQTDDTSTDGVLIPELVQLAADLDHDPIKIYEWVRNNIYYLPYHGSVKGAEKTYYDRAGNDFDTASLLIALYRESGIHSRYVYGTIRMTSEQVQNMFGADSAVLSALMLSHGGVPSNWWGIFVQAEHCWVEAYIDYDNYRGTKGKPGGGAWIPLDPSFKTYSYTPGMQVAQSAVTDWPAFWQDFFENGVTKDTAVDRYKEKIADYVAVTDPSKTIDDVPITRTIIPETLDILPLSLPYAVESIHDGYAEVPDNKRPKVSYTGFTKHEIGITRSTSFNVSLDIVSVISKRLTLQWVGATPDDQTTIDSFGGLYSTPPFMVDVKPVILANGEIKAEGDATKIDPEEYFYLAGGTCWGCSVTIRMTPGDIIGLGVDFYGHSNEYMQKQFDNLKANSASTDYDDVLGQIAYNNIAFFYYSMFNSNKTALDLRHMTNYPQTASVGFSLINSNINDLLGGAVGIAPSNFGFSAISMVTIETMHYEDIDEYVLMVAGASGSQYEALTYDLLYDTPGLSAITLIQYAYEQGIPVENNWAQYGGGDIFIGTRENPLNVQYHDWYGSGSVEGSSYYITPGLHGGASAEIFGASFPFTKLYKRADHAESYILGEVTYFIPGNCGFGEAGYFVPEGVPKHDVNINASIYEYAGATQPPPADPCSPGQHLDFILGGCWDNEVPLDQPGDVTNPYPGPPENDYTQAMFKVGSRPETPDHLLRTEYTRLDHELVMGIMAEVYTPTTKIDFVVPAGDGEVLFTDSPTGDNTPDALGNVNMTPDEFEKGDWSFEFNGGTREILQIWKDGELLMYGLTVDISAIKTLGQGIYEIYYTDDGGTTVKSLFIYVGVIINETPLESEPATPCATCGGEGCPIPSSEVAFKASIDTTSLSPIESIAWTINIYDSTGNPIAENPITVNTTVQDLDLAHVWVTNIIDSVEVFSYTITADIKFYNSIPNLTATTSGIVTVRGPHSGIAGNNSFSPYDTQLVTNANGDVTLLTQGGTDTFQPDGSGGYKTLDKSSPLKLSYSATELEYTLTSEPDNGTEIIFDDSGKLINIIDSNINTITYNYTGDQLTSIEDDVRTLTTLTYNVDGNIETETNFAGKVTTYSYDAADNLSTVTLPDNTTTTYEYYSGDPVIPDDSIKSTSNCCGGTTTTYLYDAAGKFIGTMDAEGGETYLSVDNANRTKTITDPNGNVTTMTFDRYGNVVEILYPNGSTTTYKYAADIKLKSTTSTSGITTRFTHDVNGNVTSVSDGEGKKTRFTYDSSNNVTSIEDNLGNTATFTYDSYRNMLTSTDPYGNTTSYTYTTEGWISFITLPTNEVISFVYDLYGNPTTVTSSVSGDITSTYNLSGSALTVTDPLGNLTTNTFDVMERLLTSTYDTDKVTAFTYYQNGDIDTVTAPNGVVTKYTYDLNRRPISTTRAFGTADVSITTYEYDLNGNVTTITDPSGATFTYTYNNMNQVLTTTDFDGTVTSYAYNSDGSLQSMTKADGTADARTTTYEYDSMGRTTKVTYPDLTTDEYAYSRVSGRLASAKSANGTYTYRYDLNGRMTGVTDSFTGKTISTGYDSMSRPSSITYPTGRVVQYGYDSAGRMSNISGLLDGVQTPYMTKTFDTFSRLDTLTYGNGITTTMGYGTTSELASLSTPGTNTFNYEYDNMYKKTRATDANGRDLKWDYDNLGRVRRTKAIGVNAGTEIGETMYQYDANSNRTSQRTRRYPTADEATHEADTVIPPGEENNDVGYTYSPTLTNILDSMTYDLQKMIKTGDESHQGKYKLDAEDHDDDDAAQSDIGNITFTLDAYGNTTQEVDSILGTTTYEYNDKAQLIRATMPDGTVAEYKYDVYNKRIERKATDSGGTVTLWKRYLYAGEDIIVEYDVDVADGTTLTVSAEYIHDGGVDNPIVMIRHTDIGTDTYYYHKDGLGSVTEITNAVGTVVKAYEYKTFGVINSVTGPMADTLENPYTYTSREYDSETGLYFYRARYYNAMLGRFLNKDPIGLAGGLNQFIYVGNNPLSFIDPWGEALILYGMGKYIKLAAETWDRVLEGVDVIERVYTAEQGLEFMKTYALAQASQKIDELHIFTHGNWSSIMFELGVGEVYGKFYRHDYPETKGHGDLDKAMHLSKFFLPELFQDNATIKLWGCRLGQTLDPLIKTAYAQQVANTIKKKGVTVTAAPSATTPSGEEESLVPFESNKDVYLVPATGVYGQENRTVVDWKDFKYKVP
jgi:RHS repeat-associated protein